MNKEFTRMQHLAGILTEGMEPKYVAGSDPDIDDESATMALDMMTKEGASNKMKKSEFKEKLKEAILAERALKEAKKGKEEEEDTEGEDVDIDLGTDGEDIDLNLDGEEGIGDTKVDMNMDTTGDVDAGSSESKKAFSELTDAYRAAKELGDEKLIRQIANTITYFNKNIILSQG
jgi:16S rRNA C1402 N4-methylase RsmH